MAWIVNRCAYNTRKSWHEFRFCESCSLTIHVLKRSAAHFPARQITAQFARPILRSCRHKDLAASLVCALQQRQKGAAPFEIQLSHDIIYQEHWRRTMKLREIFGLGHFEGDCQSAFLAFAPKLRRGSLIEQHLQIIAMRADQRHTIGSFALG